MSLLPFLKLQNLSLSLSLMNKIMHSSTTLTFFIILIYLPHHISSQTCQKTCNTNKQQQQPTLKYPFGSSPGCGDARFQKYITCNNKQLTLTTHTGTYPITSIDYINQVIQISDPTMSTCSCSQPSKGFGLDWNAPFSFHGDNVFALLDCSTDSSPIYKSNTGIYNGENSSAIVPLCDNEEGAPICSLLYSCKSISTFNPPISTCCVYTPIDLGPLFELDLQKLQCTSYSGFYSFNEHESNPENWNYGVALKYKFNINNDFPILCSDCEKSNGVCGYTEGDAYNSFICNCPGGFNTTTDCFFGASWSNNGGSRFLPWLTGTSLIYSLALFLV